MRVAAPREILYAMASARRAAPDRLPRSIRALGAAGGFIAGFFTQLVTLTGPDELDDGWFRRGEWAAILFVVAVAAVGLVLLITET